MANRRIWSPLSSLSGCEQLEGRQMLAADCLTDPMAVEQPTSDFESSQYAIPGSYSQASLFQASDAGSTRSTAREIGTLDGSDRLRGSLGFSDTVDMLAFDLASQSDFSAATRGFGGDIDLLLLNEDGQVVESSRRFWSSSERISTTLEAGRYYVAVFAPRFTFSAIYSLELNAQSLAPIPPIEAPDSTTPLPESEPPNNETPTPPTGSDGISAFPDVPDRSRSSESLLNVINAPESYANGYTGEGVTVAIIDSGVDLDHPDLVTNLYVNPGEIPGNGIDDDANGYVDDVNGYDFVDNDNRPDDGNGHGTHVAGTVAAADNGFGATGVAPDASIIPIRVLNDSGSGSSFDVAAGIRYAADLGADIINLSLGGGFSSTIQAAIDYAGSLGSFVIVAAGNESSATPSYPARFSSNQQHVLSVGAVDANLNRASFSNGVGNSGAVQIDAPGVGVYSTYVGGGYARLNGTSMAAPHVAGVAALALSANPSLRPEQLRSLLVGGANRNARGSDAQGVVNAATTVAYAAAGLTSVGDAERAINNRSTGIGQTGGQFTSTSYVMMSQAPEVISPNAWDVEERQVPISLDLEVIS